MTAQALPRRKFDEYRHTAVAAINGGDVMQLPNGRAAYRTGMNAAAAGDQVGLVDSGTVEVQKTTSQVWLKGSRIWFDPSTGKGTLLKPTSGLGYYLGTCDADYASGATAAYVNLNVEPRPIVDIMKDAGVTALVLTAGAPFVFNRGGGVHFGFSATAEVQKTDWLSKRSFPKTSNWIAEFLCEVITNADADVADLSLLVANGTHASDAEAIGEFVGVHLDMGADLNIDVDSDDGTTDVGITDSTVDFAVGTPFLVQLDGRDETDVQVYINGVLVAGATVFTLAAASGPLKLLVHLEKSSNDSPGEVCIHHAGVRLIDNE